MFRLKFFHFVLIGALIILSSTTAAFLNGDAVSEKPSVIVRLHNSLVTTKSNLGLYPPEKKGFTCEEMASPEFKQRFNIKKEKKNITYGNPGKFFELHNQIRTRSNEKEPSYPPNYKLNELTKARNKAGTSAIRTKSLDWIERGPANVSGRTRAIVVDPDDPEYNTWFAGAVSGGIWKTTDAGQSWTHLTLTLPNLAIGTMVMAPSNHDVMYAGTGEGLAGIDKVRGDGIFKSTNRGQNWFQLPNTIEFASVNRLIVDPNNENIVVAVVQANRFESGYYNDIGTPFGRIYKTIDGGDNWYMTHEDPDGNACEHIVFHPDNFNTQYASINTVGIFKSNDAGETWIQVLNLSESDRAELAIAPSDSAVIYAGVENAQGARLYKSTDAGESWVNLAEEGVVIPNWLGAQGWYDNTIAVNPYNSEEVYLGGINLWKTDFTTEGIIDVQQNGTETFLAFFEWGGFNNSGIGTGVQLSSSVGAPPPYGLEEGDYVSVEIRFGPGISQNAHRFIFDGQETFFADYVEVPFEVWDTDHNQQLSVSFIDVNNSTFFELLELDLNNPITEIITINSVLYSNATPDPNISGSQIGLFYKEIYAIWPILPTGGTWEPDNLPQSNLAIIYGETDVPITTINQISYGYDPYNDVGTHVDHHNITIIPLDEGSETFRIINGNDGGVFYSDDRGSTWQNTLNGYNTTQFYGVDKKPGANEYIGGMQDNGTWQSPPGEDAAANSEWLFRLGGDGYETSWHYEDPNKIIGGSQFNGLYRSTNGGENWNYIAGQIDNGGGNAPFVTKVGKTNSDPDLIFAVGVSGVWRSDNFGESWTLFEIPEQQWVMNNRTHVEISYANPQVVWAGTRMNDTENPEATLHVSTDCGLSFTPTAMYTEVDMGILTGLNTHPIDDSTAYALFSFADAPKILQTTDLGKSWEDISGFGANSVSDNGFPDVVTYCLLVMPHNPDIIWVGTEIGLFESTDNGQNWHYADNGLPAVAIWQMKITDDQVVLATHGRGIWSVTIPELPPPPVVTRSPGLQAVLMGPDGFLKIVAHLRSPYDSTQVIMNDEVYRTIATNEAPLDTTYNIVVTEEMDVTVQLKAYKNEDLYLSAKLSTTAIPMEAPQAGYTNDFNTSSNDFTGNGFTIRRTSSLADRAIHTIHPYQDGQELLYLLRVPIIVSESDAFINFDEIAIIEPGDPGSVFGDQNFWDYVIVEGTADGFNWLPLLDGYDARSDPAWLDVYNNGGSVVESLYRSRTIDISQTFNPGETILIRFRLFADGYVTGWGWVIDNLEIQQLLSAVDGKEKILTPKSFNLSQNYPNPFNPATTILFSIPKTSHVTLKIYDVMGREVKTLIKQKFEQGNYEVFWNAENLASGTYFYRLKTDDFEQTKKMTLIK